jgi:hypothetical protein
VIAAAVAARAHLIVSGDRKHLLPIGAHQGIAIVTARQALEQRSGVSPLCQQGCAAKAGLTTRLEARGGKNRDPAYVLRNVYAFSHRSTCSMLPDNGHARPSKCRGHVIAKNKFQTEYYE